MTFDVSILTKKVPFMLAGAAAAAMFAGSTAHAADSNATGYVYSPEVSTANGGWNWLENGKPYTGFRYHAGTFYWFVNGVRQNEGWRQAWGLTYYTDQDGRAVQGTRIIGGQVFNFGDDNTYYKRPLQGYIWDNSPANGGYRWYENGQLYTGFRYYAGTYYWFVDGVRQNEGWRQAWGLNYYTNQDGRAVQGQVTIDGTNYDFGNDGTYYLRIPGTNTATQPGFGGAPDADKSKDTIPAPTTATEPEQKQETAQPAQPAVTTDTNQTPAPNQTPARTYTGWVENKNGDTIWQKSDFTSMKDAFNTAAKYLDDHVWDKGSMKPHSYGAY
ncbi:Glucan-binding domain (YG repeat) [Fructobacillus fructosus]|uniref:Glucan-binding domain (YG repeat) n=1 Tax=Fructobacillus fructosus TaxID=1631 RepID=A0ABM9N001_9LACO|nr:Glucan-binding domain (YG repeat) [Fructobacillus fructosus]CAK1251785.1 Glucan-binding domain (YG repeat) [Fructobacillus fructosus]